MKQFSIGLIVLAAALVGVYVVGIQLFSGEQFAAHSLDVGESAAQKVSLTPDMSPLRLLLRVSYRPKAVSSPGVSVRHACRV